MNSKGHGGKREGAGRKRKWSFASIIKIGQECETLFRIEEKKTLDRAKDHTFNADSELKHLWKTPARIPVSKRRDFVKSDLYSDHRENIEIELKYLAGNIFSDSSPPRILQMSCKPPRGTRKKIIAQIALKNGLKLNQVDNLW